MFRKLAVAGFLLAVSGQAKAAWQTREMPIYDVGTNTVVVVSSSAWTCVPAASSLGGRVGVKVLNPSSNTHTVYGTFAKTTPTVSTSTFCTEIPPGAERYYELPNAVDLYLVGSDTTGGVSVGVQEIKQ